MRKKTKKQNGGFFGLIHKGMEHASGKKIDANFVSILYRVTKDGEKIELGRGEGKKKIVAQQEASLKALEKFKNKNGF